MVRRGTRKRAIWVNVPFSFTFTETVNFNILLVPEDWEAQFAGNGNETAVLRAVRGVCGWVQTVGGTLGGNAFWGLCILDKDATVSPTFSVAGMGDADWLHTDAYPTQAAVSSTNVAVQRREMDIKAKRRLKSRDGIYIVGQHGADAASPSSNIVGILRFLIARD